jgi:hypothetical protein
VNFHQKKAKIHQEKLDDGALVTLCLGPIFITMNPHPVIVAQGIKVLPNPYPVPKRIHLEYIQETAQNQNGRTLNTAAIHKRKSAGLMETCGNIEREEDLDGCNQ